MWKYQFYILKQLQKNHCFDIPPVPPTVSSAAEGTSSPSEKQNIKFVQMKIFAKKKNKNSRIYPLCLYSRQ